MGVGLSAVVRRIPVIAAIVPGAGSGVANDSGQGVSSITFEGYCFKPPRSKRVAIFGGIVVFVAFLGGWVTLIFLIAMPHIQNIVMVVWVGLLAGAVMYVQGPRRQQWGHGTLSHGQVVWESSASIRGDLVRRWRPPRLLIQGPRYLFFLLLMVTIALAVVGHTPTFLTQNKPDLAVFLVLAFQSWLTPFYRETFRIQTASGPRRIYVTKICGADADASA